MSAKGRGKPVVDKHDHVRTPAWTVDRLFEVPEIQALPGGTWLEPGAGNGAIIRAVAAHRSDIAWYAVELQAKFRSKLYDAGAAVVTIGDFLRDMPPRLSEVAVVMGNPPFSLALPFIEQCRRICPGRDIVLLLALGIVASEKRHAFMSADCPNDLPLPNRPSFKLVGNETDAQDYGWFHWPPEARRRGFVQVLGLTSKAERRARR